ncbi:hypothetical protein GJ744_009356 [Endocarpon pusillum]|uniref:NACHT domain-containing protein n=1 Tax=Endocarpon pusillum TaxID=364733 RepID=A0A8H7AFV5_9EURO|nr:hypothetical protein GJ744_009356 [Endocarpon pusillum]
MDPLSVTASIIAVVTLTGQVISYLNDVRSAPKTRARFAKEAANVQCLLISLRYHLDESTPEDLWFKEVRKLTVENGPIDQFRLAIEQLMTKVEPKAGLKKVGETLLWKLNEKDVEEILSRIERLKSIIQIAIQMDHVKLSQAIKKDTAVISQSIMDLTQNVDAIHQKQKGQFHREVLNWLSGSDFAAQQSDYISKRQEGTGLWFINSPKFAEWLHGSKHTLFCPGIPGAGKTMIASIVTDHLWKAYQEDDIGVAYLYCNYKRGDEQKAVNLLAVILKQLVQERPSLPDSVGDLYTLHGKRGTRPSFDELSNSLRSVLRNYSRVFIIIDALDECTNDDGTRNTLLSEIRSLQVQTDVRLMVTSRNISNITQLFEDDLCLRIYASDEDVEQYLEGRMSRQATPILQNPDLRQRISKSILGAIGGMFLLARLHMDSLIHKPTVKAIKKALAKLSTGEEALNKAYEGAKERIEIQSEESCDLAKNLISWILCAQRPLTTRELQHALAVEPGERQLDEENIPDLALMLSVCAGLVTLDEESKIIRFVHYTTQDYFERIQTSWLPHISAYISLTCTTYLSFDAFTSGRASHDKEFEDRLAQNPFLDYAARYWASHVGRVEDKVKEVVLTFLSDKSLVSCAFQVMSAERYKYPYRGYSQAMAERVTALHLLAGWGLEDWLTYVLKDVVDADSKDSEGRTPLSWAAEYGYKEIVEILLAQDDVEADSKDNEGRTPLSRAVGYGQEEIVEILLAQDDVEADSKDNKGRTPLSRAAAYGHEEIVRTLLAQDDVEADSKDNEGRTPLSRAAENGYKEIVRTLLAQDDVEADSKDNEGRTPLSFAAAEGYKEIVEILLAQDDVEADLKDNEGRTPLSFAVGYGQEEIVEILLAQDDVKADSKDNEGRTPLSRAAAYGHEEIVRTLLAQDDVEADSKDNKGRTPLSWAAARGREDIVKILLAQDDVEADSKDNEGRTPLSWAAEQGHRKIVDLLT